MEKEEGGGPNSTEQAHLRDRLKSSVSGGRMGG